MIKYSFQRIVKTRATLIQQEPGCLYSNTRAKRLARHHLRPNRLLLV